ncbi:hypothetical protein ABKN59_007968 [Abortiporus biennis]
MDPFSCSFFDDRSLLVLMMLRVSVSVSLGSVVMWWDDYDGFAEVKKSASSPRTFLLLIYIVVPDMISFEASFKAVPIHTAELCPPKLQAKIPQGDRSIFKRHEELNEFAWLGSGLTDERRFLDLHAFQVLPFPPSSGWTEVVRG